MKTLRRLLLLAIVLYLAGSMGGCIAFYTYHKTPVAVYDAETKAPIAGAQIDLNYMCMLILNPPRSESVTTDQTGKAVVRTATFEVPRWDISAKGYRLEDQLGTDKDGMQFYLYREPLPQMTIVVPNGYRGPVKIDMRPVKALVQDRPGKREFTFKTSPTGYVRIEATPLLMGVNFIGNVHAVYENGHPIPFADYRVGPSETAFRWITGDDANAQHDDRELFVVGTEQDENALHRIIYDYKNGNLPDVSSNQERFDALFDPSK